MEDTSLHSLLAKLERLRQSRVILYFGQTQGHFLHQLAQEDLHPLFTCLRQQERAGQLDVILHTVGGSVTAARTVCHLFHTYGQRLNMLIPFKARSAATLLCLGAHTVVMGPLGELSPIDPLIAQANAPSPGLPSTVSSEDIRGFQEMAQSWFGLQGEEQNRYLLRLLCQRIFPTSLSAFFRATQYVEQTAEELLSVQLSKVSQERRREIIDVLVHGYYTHDHVITRSDAIQLGLAVEFTSREQEELLWQIWECASEQFLTPFTSLTPSSAQGQVVALIASATFLARQVIHVVGTSNETVGDRPGVGAPVLIEKRWEFSGHERSSSESA